MPKLLIIFIACLCTTHSTFAADNDIYDTTSFRMAQTDCNNIYSGPQEAMCNSHLYELNKKEESVYKEFIAWAKSPPNKYKNSITETIGFKSTFPKTLEDSENAWKDYRDSTCRLEAEGFSGTGQSSLIVECLAEKTKNRVDFLKELRDRLQKN